MLDNLNTWLSLLSCSWVDLLVFLSNSNLLFLLSISNLLFFLSNSNLLFFLSNSISSLLFFLFIASANVTANCHVECQLKRN